MGLSVGLVYNLGKHDPPAEGEPPDVHAELDSEHTVLAVADALREGGHEVLFIEGDAGVCERLRATRPDIVFNMSEGIRGASREAHVPCILELLGIPYTGSGPLTMAVSLDKPAAKRAFAADGVPTPKSTVCRPGALPDRTGLKFPLFVKPAGEGSSMGIGPNSLVADEAALHRQVEYIHRFYQQPALIEEYIDGREFTIGLLGNGDELAILPIMEINFAPCPSEHGRIYSYQFKTQWDGDEYYQCPAPLAEDQAALLADVAKRAFRCLDCRDVARVDVRLDQSGMPWVLEVNPLPGLVPGFSDLPREAAAAGMTYAALINAILNDAVARQGVAFATPSTHVLTA